MTREEAPVNGAPYPADEPGFLASVGHDLEDKFGIHHITLQLEDCRENACAQASIGSL